MKTTKSEGTGRPRGRPSRSPGRTASRSPGRKSPGRAKKTTPTRKSPARDSPKSKPPPSPSPSRRGPKSKKAAAAASAAPDTANGLRERKVVTDAPPPPPPSARRSTRTKTSDYEAVLKLARSKELPKLKSNLSDDETVSEDDTPIRLTRSGTRKLVTPLIPAVEPVKPSLVERIQVIVQFPTLLILVLGVNALCEGSPCSFSNPLGSVKNLWSCDRWYKPQAIALYSCFVCIVTAVSALPCLGKRVSCSDGTGFVANGWFAALLSIVAAAAVDKLYCPVFEPLTRDWFPLILPAEVLGIVAGVVVFLAGRKSSVSAPNESGNTGIVPIDLWLGRVINPVLLKRLNVKVILLRSAMILALILNVAALQQGTTLKPIPALSLQSIQKLQTIKQLASVVSIDSTLLVFAGLQIVYFVHALLSEPILANTFEIQQEGTGLMLTLGYSLYPFTTPLITKYVLRNRVTLSNVQLAVTLLVFAIGFFIYHASNYQKSAFRKNPLDPKLAHLDSLPTFQGNRLLISGWWGLLRHPNYLGDIILHLAFGFATITAPPIICIVFTVLFLVQRTLRDDARCRKRYGAAWDRYCNRVPKVLIPKIY